MARQQKILSFASHDCQVRGVVGLIFLQIFSYFLLSFSYRNLEKKEIDHRALRFIQITCWQWIVLWTQYQERTLIF